MAKKVILQNVRLGPFPDLHTAKQYQGKGAFNYKVTLLVDKKSQVAKDILAAYQEVAKEAWQEKANARLEEFKGNKLMTFILDGDKTADKGGHAGCLVVSAKKKQEDGRPEVRARNKQLLAAGDDGYPYGGCYVNAVLEVWAQTKENPGMRCKVLGVQFVKDGDAFIAGSKASEDDFEDLSDGADAPDVGMAASGGGGLV